MPKPILNIADVEFRKVGHGSNFPGAEKAPEKFSTQVGDIGRRIGAQKIGCNLTVVLPGKRAWPFHNHRVNEEMFAVMTMQSGPDGKPKFWRFAARDGMGIDYFDGE